MASILEPFAKRAPPNETGTISVYASVNKDLEVSGLDSNYYTKAEVDGLFLTKLGAAATYETTANHTASVVELQGEVDDKITDEEAAAKYATISNVNTALALKANVEDVYDKTTADTALATKLGVNDNAVSATKARQIEYSSSDITYSLKPNGTALSFFRDNTEKLKITSGGYLYCQNIYPNNIYFGNTTVGQSSGKWNGTIANIVNVTNKSTADSATDTSKDTYVPSYRVLQTSYFPKSSVIGASDTASSDNVYSAAAVDTKIASIPTAGPTIFYTSERWVASEWTVSGAQIKRELDYEVDFSNQYLYNISFCINYGFQSNHLVTTINSSYIQIHFISSNGMIYHKTIFLNNTCITSSSNIQVTNSCSFLTPISSLYVKLRFEFKTVTNNSSLPALQPIDEFYNPLYYLTITKQSI